MNWDVVFHKKKTEKQTSNFRRIHVICRIDFLLTCFNDPRYSGNSYNRVIWMLYKWI